jgi:aminomethyltransferase
MAETTETADQSSLPLDAWHRVRGARMVPFAGYAMPVQYEGVIAEHLWTRTNVGLFDVSHMGQLTFHGERVDAALETLMPGDLRILKDGRLRYSMLLDEDGGIIDDLMATRRGDHFYVVVNGATKLGDIEQFEQRLPKGVILDHMKEQALLALQGPRAAGVLEGLAPGVSDLSFMQSGAFTIAGTPAWVSRSGYTGEDGFEISIAATAVVAVADALVANEAVKPIGLGARDSLTSTVRRRRSWPI